MLRVNADHRYPNRGHGPRPEFIQPKFRGEASELSVAPRLLPAIVKHVGSESATLQHPGQDFAYTHVVHTARGCFSLS